MASKIFIYTAIEENDDDKHKRYKDLEPEYIVRIKTVHTYSRFPFTKNAKCPNCGKRGRFLFKRNARKKGNCDASMTLDIVRNACEDKFDHAIILSGDGDFAMIYEFLVDEMGKKVTVIAPSGIRTHTDVKKMGEDKIIQFEPLDVLHDYAFRKPPLKPQKKSNP